MGGGGHTTVGWGWGGGGGVQVKFYPYTKKGLEKVWAMLKERGAKRLEVVSTRELDILAIYQKKRDIIELYLLLQMVFCIGNAIFIEP